ncbi:hypothetical protein FB565_003398 [Actinoplanes lutulentus]|nr:hypothetical protein [Actinoplanes lutulentus]
MHPGLPLNRHAALCPRQLNQNIMTLLIWCCARENGLQNPLICRDQRLPGRAGASPTCDSPR